MHGVPRFDKAWQKPTVKAVLVLHWVLPVAEGHADLAEHLATQELKMKRRLTLRNVTRHYQEQGTRKWKVNLQGQ